MAVTFTIAPAGAQAFSLGFQDLGFFRPATAQTDLATTKIVDGSWERILVRWASVVPNTSTMPAAFDASNPADPQYDFKLFDAVVRAAVQDHLRVIFTLTDAPTWAQGPGQPSGAPIDTNIQPGAWDPNPSEFGAFAHAIALRYSGHFPDPLHPGADLPRISYWEIWNEENLPQDLAAPNLVGEYRQLLDAGYSAIKSVSRNDKVLVGGLAPVSYLAPLSISPLKFAAQLMCLQRKGTVFRPTRSCRQHAYFDIFADHPYTLAATPTKHAYHYDDVLIGDMAKIKHVVAAADRFHTVRPKIKHPIWVTEWSWITNPPNPTVGDSDSTAARYVAWSMYEMWSNNVSVVLWFTIEDPPGSPSNSADFFSGGGLYTSSGAPKLMLRAFSFPLVAWIRKPDGYVWGRAPVSTRTRVYIQHEVRKRWKHVATAHTHRDGTFTAHFRAHANGTYRARIGHGPVSLPYNSRPIPGKRTHAFYSG